MFDKFKKGDFVFIHNTAGKGIGNFEINKITDSTPLKMDLKYPLTHNYKNDFENHSQVVRIPQYSFVNIEKDVYLFHKAISEGKGGVIVFMASKGFSIKGYIIDSKADVEVFELNDLTKISKSKSGVIFGLANYEGNIARKVFDIKFTTRYPTITLPSDKTLLVSNNGESYQPGRFQHITIPPDLNLHLTSEKGERDYIFFKPQKSLIDSKGSLSKEYIKLVSVTNPSIDECPIFTNRKYSAGVMVAFAKMPHWNTQSHFTIEVFALQNETIRIPIQNHKQGELGVFLPSPAFYKDDSSGKTIKYFLQVFTIMNHTYERPILVEFW